MTEKNKYFALDPLGILRNGYDYELQCWVFNYQVQRCGHPRPKAGAPDCDCKGREYSGCRITDAREREGLKPKDPRAPLSFLEFARAHSERGALGIDRTIGAVMVLYLAGAAVVSALIFRATGFFSAWWIY
jgi:hypothetical protein